MILVKESAWRVALAGRRLGSGRIERRSLAGPTAPLRMQSGYGELCALRDLNETNISGRDI